MDTLANTDREDIAETLLIVERSFGIAFAKNELAQVATFGELCDVVVDKLPSEHSGTCTSQQAFYRLRAAFQATYSRSLPGFAPASSLHELLPHRNRRQQVARLEAALGLPLKLLAPKNWVVMSLLGLLLGSFLACFWHPLIGLMGLAGSIGGFCLAAKFGSELAVPTVAGLVERLVEEHYAQVRRQAGTVNPREVPAVLQRLFARQLGLKLQVLLPDSPFL